jgi:hypothetical protein
MACWGKEKEFVLCFSGDDLGRKRELGRPSCRWECNIKMDLRNQKGVGLD